MFLQVLLLILFLAIAGYFSGKILSVRSVGGTARDLHSLPSYHGGFVALAAFLPATLVAVVWSVVAPGMIETAALEAAGVSKDLPFFERNGILREIYAVAEGGNVLVLTAAKQAGAEVLQQGYSQSNFWIFVVTLVTGLIGGFLASRAIAPRFRARHHVERIVRTLLIACSVVAVLTTLGIVMSLVFESYRFFTQVPLTEFLFGTTWSPQTALRADQVGSSSAFGAVPLFAGTLLITFIAILVAAPVGLMSAIYLSDYASSRVRAVAKPMLEVLAGIPTVVYGFFAALTVAPFFRDIGNSVGLTVSAESALAAGLVMGIMIIPFVSSLTDDVINAVPQSLRDGSQGLGATKSETIRKVVLPAALPGIVSALLLAISRAIGETMIVVMAAGLAANLTANPLEAVTTVTVQIVTLLVGDQEFDSAKTLSAFALGLVLFCITLFFNVIALKIVKMYREQYD